MKRVTTFGFGGGEFNLALISFSWGTESDSRDDDDDTTGDVGGYE
jgi:hypothetical protein